MSHFTSHVVSDEVVRTVVVVQPSLSPATTPAPKSPTAAQLFGVPVQHSALSAPVLSHVPVAHSEAAAPVSAEVPAAHVIVEPASYAQLARPTVGAASAAASAAHVTVAVCAT